MRASKRDQIVDAAMDLFYRGGFNATGIGKVLADARVAKMTLYNHFRSKEELILAVLRRRDEQFRDQLTQAVECCQGAAQDKLQCLFDVLADWFVQDGFRGSACSSTPPLSSAASARRSTSRLLRTNA